jgi:hypothetical protein
MISLAAVLPLPGTITSRKAHMAIVRKRAAAFRNRVGATQDQYAAFDLAWIIAQAEMALYEQTGGKAGMRSVTGRQVLTRYGIVDPAPTR